MAEFRPMSDYVLVQVPEAKKQTESGILLPESAAQEKPQYGEVMAVGPGRLLESGELVPMHLSVGDKVLFGSYAGVELKVGNQKFLVIRQDDILLVEMKEKSDDAEDSGS